MNRTTFLTGRRVVKVSAGFLVGKSEVVTPISGSMAVGPGLCSPPQTGSAQLLPPPELCGHSISPAGGRGAGDRGWHAAWGPTTALRWHLSGDLRPGEPRHRPTPTPRAAVWPPGGGYKKQLLGKRAAAS